MIVHICFLLFSCLVLIKSADILIKSLVKIAYFLNLSEFTVGFIIMSFATSTPELFVGIGSAINKTPALSLGNAIGSNILDITLIAGLIILLAKGIKAKGNTLNKNTLYILAIVIILLLLSLDKNLSRADGAILLLIYFVYMAIQFKERKKFKKTLKNGSMSGIPKQFLLFLIGIIVLIISSHFVVKFATLIALDLNLSIVLVGLIIVSLGTSLPELTFEMRAVNSGHEGMAVGDLLGSFVTNITLVVGLVALLSPIIIGDFTLYLTSVIFLFIVVFFFAIFTRTKKELSRQEGMTLIMFYVGFIIIELIVHSVNF